MRQALMASSQTIQGSPLTLESFASFCRSRTTPRRVQALGIVNPSRSAVVSAGFLENSCAREALVRKAPARQRVGRNENSHAMKLRSELMTTMLKRGAPRASNTKKGRNRDVH